MHLLALLGPRSLPRMRKVLPSGSSERMGEIRDRAKTPRECEHCPC